MVDAKLKQLKRQGQGVWLPLVQPRCARLKVQLKRLTEQGKLIAPFYQDTDIFITPGFNFKVVDALVTNFHLSESTLLMLVSAFAGYDHIMQCLPACSS